MNSWAGRGRTPPNQRQERSLRAKQSGRSGSGVEDVRPKATLISLLPPKFRFDQPRPSVVRLSKSYWDRHPADAASAICAAETSETTISEELSSERVNGIFDELYVGIMIPTVAILRWRYGLAEGPPNPGRNSKGYCSDDGKSWREVSIVRGIQLSLEIAARPLPALVHTCINRS